MKIIKRIFHARGVQKKVCIAIHVSDKIGFNPKVITRDKDGHYILIKESIHQEDITIVNIYTPNIGAPKYIKQIITHLKRNRQYINSRGLQYPIVSNG